MDKKDKELNCLVIITSLIIQVQVDEDENSNVEKVVLKGDVVNDQGNLKMDCKIERRNVLNRLLEV